MIFTVHIKPLIASIQLRYTCTTVEPLNNGHFGNMALVVPKVEIKFAQLWGYNEFTEDLAYTIIMPVLFLMIRVPASLYCSTHTSRLQYVHTHAHTGFNLAREDREGTVSVLSTVTWR